MKFLILFSLAVSCVAAGFEHSLNPNTAYGYIQNIAIPLAEEIRKVEETDDGQRIVGGSPSQLGQFPYQAGLLASYQGLDGTGVCGGSLVSANRVITAAHCWFDGINQAFVVTVVLGSVNLFSGGVRQDTSAVIMHPNWIPLLVRNDVAMIYLADSVSFSSTIAPVSLPSGSEINENFAGESAVASGYGLTSDEGAISGNQVLSHVQLNVITNNVCFLAFPLYLRDSNICTSGVGGSSVCRGDSGGPLVVTRNNRQIMIGITSFGSPLGCEFGMPAAFARVTSFLDFFNQHL